MTYPLRFCRQLLLFKPQNAVESFVLWMTRMKGF